MFRPIFLLLAAALLVVPAIAKSGERSLVIGYPVKGTSAKAIYDDIKAQSPRIAANATFSFMAMATKTDKTERKSKDSCGYSRFRTSVVYSFILPKLSSSKGVKPALAAQWLNFYDYLKTHEEGHRSIWRVCFAEYDQLALDLSARDCGVVGQEARKALHRHQAQVHTPGRSL